MKFLIFLALCLAFAQAHVVSPVLSTYAAVPAVSPYSLGVAAPVVRAAPLLRTSPLVSSVYSAPVYSTYSAAVPAVAPAVYAAPAVYSTLLKK